VSGGKVIRHIREHRTNPVGSAFRMAAQSLIGSKSYLAKKPLPKRARRNTKFIREYSFVNLCG
jgi:hypothetical protein